MRESKLPISNHFLMAGGSRETVENCSTDYLVELDHRAEEMCENSGFSAPKARNVIAQGNALGKVIIIPQALKARNSISKENIQDFAISLSFRAFGAEETKFSQSR